MRYVRRTLLCVLLMCAVSLGQTASTDNTQLAVPTKASVKYLSNEITSAAKDPESGGWYFVASSGFAYMGPANQWIRLDLEFRLSQAIPLVDSAGRMISKRWNILFTPEGQNIRWTNCSLGVDAADLEAAENLPKGKSFAVWVMGAVWDYDQEQYLDSGWNVSTAVLITTDDNGKVTHMQVLPKFEPIQIESVHPNKGRKVKVRKINLNTKHLKLNENVTLFEMDLGTDGNVNNTRRGALDDSRRIWDFQQLGTFLEPIDTPEKAEEFAKLLLSERKLITKKQYDAIAHAASTVDNKKILIPELHGLRITKIDGLGWQAEALCAVYRDSKFDNIENVRICIMENGRIARTNKNYLRISTPQDQSERMTNEQYKRYYSAISSVIHPAECEIVPSMIEQTGEIVTVSVGADAPKNIIDAKPIQKPSVPKPPATKPIPTSQPISTQPDSAPAAPAKPDDTPVAPSPPANAAAIRRPENPLAQPESPTIAPTTQPDAPTNPPAEPKPQIPSDGNPPKPPTS